MLGQTCINCTKHCVIILGLRVKAYLKFLNAPYMLWDCTVLFFFRTHCSEGLLSFASSWLIKITSHLWLDFFIIDSVFCFLVVIVASHGSWISGMTGFLRRQAWRGLENLVIIGKWIFVPLNKVLKSHCNDVFYRFVVIIQWPFLILYTLFHQDSRLSISVVTSSGACRVPWSAHRTRIGEQHQQELATKFAYSLSFI